MNSDNPHAGIAVAPRVSGTEALKQAEDRNQEEHLNTDHLVADLKARTVSSGAVTISAQGAKFLLNLVSTMILARLLLPRDFGLVAMVATVTGFLRVFKDAGLSVATVQREKITQAQVSNLFWINVGVSVVCTLIMAASAPIVAHFYHDRNLVRITLFLSTTFLISGSTVQHQALLRRQMRFGALALIDVGSMAVGVLIGIIMAISKHGYWSLVASSLSMEVSGLVLTWSVSRWRPHWPVRNSGIAPLITFGAHRTAADFISSLARGSDNLLIGRFCGPMSLGLYSRASALLIKPLELFLNPISNVFIPALSRLQDDPGRYRATFLRLYEAIVLTGFVFCGLFLALARPLTLVLLGPKWDQTAVIFGGFTIAALCIPLTNAAGWVLITQGRGRDMLVAQSINSFGMVVSFVAGLPYGAVGVAVAYSIWSLVMRLPIWNLVVGQRGAVRTADLWQAFFRHVPVWIVVFSTTWLMLWVVSHRSSLVQLLICAPVGLLAGAGFIFSVTSQRRVAIYLLRAIREGANVNWIRPKLVSEAATKRAPCV